MKRYRCLKETMHRRIYNLVRKKLIRGFSFLPGSENEVYEELFN